MLWSRGVSSATNARDDSALMTRQLCDGGPDGWDALVRLLMVYKLFSSTTVNVSGAMQKSEFFGDGEIASSSDYGAESAEFQDGIAERHADQGGMLPSLADR